MGFVLEGCQDQRGDRFNYLEGGTCKVEVLGDLERGRGSCGGLGGWEEGRGRWGEGGRWGARKGG